jgi:hypothetical protein
MPALGTKFAQQANETLLIAANTETLWLTARPTSIIRTQLKVPQLEALYEATYLRVFATWENLLEDVLLHMMAKYETANYVPVASAGSALYRTIVAAKVTLYGGRRYLLWHNVQTVIDRTRSHLASCPMEAALSGAAIRLENYSVIRHRIAHDSADAVANFKSASISLSGSDQAGRAGRLLRAPNIADPLNQPKWIRVIVDDLITIAFQFAQ